MCILPVLGAAVVDTIAVNAYRATIGRRFFRRALRCWRREATASANCFLTLPWTSWFCWKANRLGSPWRKPVAECVRLLWDAGLRLNHTVRTVSECLEFREQNIDLDINLLDLRYLYGDKALFSRLENKWPAFLEQDRLEPASRRSILREPASAAPARRRIDPEPDAES